MIADPLLPSTLRVRQEGPVAVLTLARAEKRNALNDATIEGVRLFFQTLPKDVRAVVIHGAGEHFCAGLDLGEVTGEPDLMAGILHSRMWHKAFHEIEFGPVPVFSVLHGATVGGGLELAAATHVRIAERSAYYALPEGQRGIFLGGGGSVRISKLIGVARVQDLMLTGRTLSAEEGLAAGVSQYLVDDGAGLAKAISLAKKAAGNAVMTNYAIIHALPHIAEAAPATGLFTESLMAAIAETTPEAQARLRAFLDKKAAKITHKG
ncbi:MAG: crotonase/enoyl-CoA hydratase family protein [Beijerinckiaceae bacterium]